MILQEQQQQPSCRWSHLVVPEPDYIGQRGGGREGEEEEEGEEATMATP
jgi:hypothetical protein